jgi:formylglycine-generating enzyme required for sulfatase activity
MACIPGGPFLRGSTQGNPNEQPQATVTVDAFLMDVTEVTVEAHNACVAAHHCKPVNTVYPDFSRPKQPKVGVRWYDAVDFCKAMNKHLPTEAEWEKAARGTDGRLYPWGNEIATCELAVIKDKRGRSCGVPQKSNEPDKGRTFEVATRPPNQYGLYDMSGNAWEWVADWYSKSYAACGDACLGTNPKGPCGGAEPCAGHTERVVRGGSWFWEAPLATTTYRREHFPSNNPYHHYGFRCAASLAEAAAIREAGKAAH